MSPGKRNPRASGVIPVSDLRQRGIAAAPGIAIGRAFLVDRRRLKVPKRRVEEDEIDSEIERFCRAIDASDRQLERIKQKIQEQKNDHYNIIAAHQLILRDSHVVDATVKHIREDHINAEWALRKTVEHIKGVFDAIEDDYFRERRSDVDFVGERILRNLLGRDDKVKPPPDAIVVAHDLSPADTAQLYRAAVAGLATDAGGETSHTAIMARAHEIPAVVGLEDITGFVGNGDLIIIDGNKGEVILAPEAETVAQYRDLARRHAAAEVALLQNRTLPAQTLDDELLTLMSNIDHTDEIGGALAHGAEGIGLYRSEYMFMGTDEIPNEDDHYRDAIRVLELIGDRPCTFRTVDLGSDKVSRLLSLQFTEANPALGLRSIRLCLSPTMVPHFIAQLRGLLRASAHGRCRLMFPMISGVVELRQVKQLLEQVKEDLRREQQPFDENLKVGIMIEMPSAAMVADHLAKEVDFFSIGTNDLIQYTLAVDRVNEHVSYLYEPLHPALLRLIARAIDAANDEGISVSMCGEMAGDPDVAPILVGLGLREMSMNAVAIPEIKQVIRGCNAAGLAVLARHVLTLPTGEAVRQAAREYADREIGGTQ